ncbi:hypothetical protein [Methylobacterium oxalidis]|uniref:hypothetical protein n=1 Tax=Methylobacterium oxalidis TaxID=944322 RepID=UPI003314AFC9
MNRLAPRSDDDRHLDEVTEAARLEGRARLRGRSTGPRARSAAEREAIARLAEAEGSEDVGRPGRRRDA